MFADRAIGGEAPCFIIAEAGVNHDGDIATACELVHAAADAGADAVKFQTFTADGLATPSTPKAAYQEKTTDGGETHYQMLRRLELDETAHRLLMETAQSRGIMFLSSPFSEESADLLQSLDVAAFKIPSGELTNCALIDHIAALGRPVILSTGMASMAETTTAVKQLQSGGSPDVVLLQCVSNYPANPADCNLSAMKTMRDAFDVPVGFSDHTLGSEVAHAAVALGACVIEKHFTLDTARDGPDHAASMQADKFCDFVSSIRAVESALGHGTKMPASSEAPVAAVARRSLVAAFDIPEGATIEDAMVVARRQGVGLPPAARNKIVGRRACSLIAAGTLLSLDMIA